MSTGGWAHDARNLGIRVLLWKRCDIARIEEAAEHKCCQAARAEPDWVEHTGEARELEQ